jgi:hypothetical protein
VAEVMVQKAAELKKEDADVTVAPEQGEEVGPRRPERRRANLRQLYDVSDEPVESSGKGGNPLTDVLGLLVGGQVRFLLGAVLLLVSLYWMHSRAVIAAFTSISWFDTNAWKFFWAFVEGQGSLQIPLVPEAVIRPLCSVNAAVAGLVLVLSVFWSSRLHGLVQVLAAALMIGSPLFIPAGLPLGPSLLGLAVGAAVSVLGFLFLRRSEW